jgi:uncharacterized protein
MLVGIKTSLLRYYWLALLLSFVVFSLVFFKSGAVALWPIFILAVIEVTFSFDNAVLNSEVLGRMSHRWRLIFLTVGIAVAVFGVRLIMPLVLVAVTTSDSIGHVLDLALHSPEEYSHRLHEGYPIIAAFGGTFLLMIGLRFLAEDRETKWIKPLERRVAGWKRPWLVPIGGALLIAGALGTVLRPGQRQIIIASLLGAAIFLAIKYISNLIEKHHPASNTGSSNFVNFLYLELLDASFSFDGVVAAFAITKDVVLIAAGLGIGALFVRSATIHLLERGTLNEYRYLIHGAHYAIAVLGSIMLLSTRTEIPEWITGLIGIVIIAWSIISSVRHNRRAKAAEA